MSEKKLFEAYRAQIKRSDSKTSKRIANLTAYIAKVKCDLASCIQELELFSEEHYEEAIFREILCYLKNGKKTDNLDSTNFVRELRTACIRCCREK